VDGGAQRGDAGAARLVVGEPAFLELVDGEAAIE
jgi:hypothetical protein